VIYDQIFNCDVRLLPEDHYQDYDVALIIDVIEHMSRPEGHRLLWAIRRAGCYVVLSTPKVFEHQHDDANPYEMHVSHWAWNHLRPHRIVADESTIDSIIYLLGPA
jgi:2-polyprenyl-3-methyl-5-hydroxy-6-metoxy-1,4-benzoquinol methylase